MDLFIGVPTIELLFKVLFHWFITYIRLSVDYKLTLLPTGFIV